MEPSNQETGGGSTVLAATQTPRTTGMMWGQERGEGAATFRSAFAGTAKYGAYLRPAAMLVELASRFDCQLKIECNRSVADSKRVKTVMIVGNGLLQAR